MNIKISFLLFLLSVLIGGCAKIQPPESLSVNTQTTNINQTVTEVSGALAAKNRRQGWTATFNWLQHSPQNYQILINGPVGTEALNITMDNGVFIYREGRKTIKTQNPEQLLAKETGIHLPVRHLYYWIKGLPAPGPIDTIVRDTDKNITLLKQAGFVLEFNEYRNHLPYRIRINGHELLIKITVSHWR